MELKKVIHLIPFDGVGGVERAACTMRRVSNDIIDFKVITIFPECKVKRALALWNPWYYFKTVMLLIKEKPDLLIVSLWRSYIVGCLTKIAKPKMPLVVFLHSAKNAHLLDKLITTVASKLSNCVWADSNETMKSRIANISVKKKRIVSFITERIVPNCLNAKSAPQPAFIFWGRLHVDKGLLKAVRLFFDIYKLIPYSTFTIIGPDGGLRDELIAEIKHLGLDNAVKLMGTLSFDQIKEESTRASFYLQSSKLEGMAMSVVEAMQLGLVPIVTPVGEIANYCNHAINSLIIQDHQQTVVDSIVKLLDDSTLYMTIRSNAIATWCDKPLYKDDVIRACQELLT